MTTVSSFSLFFLIAGASMTPKCFSLEIVGGEEVPPHSRPFMASLQYKGGHICGGVLIHPQWVLTAAHCRHRFARRLAFQLVLGAHSLSKSEASKQTFEIAKFIPFPKFASDPDPNDIMLVKLHTAAKLDENVQLLQPSTRNDIRPGTKCQVTGWGVTDPELQHLSDTLREVTVTTISQQLCNSHSYYNHHPIITKGMVCAGDAKGQKDACQGDSGGPLLCNGAFYGLVSSGHKCGNARKPGIYVLLTTKFQAWIKRQLPRPPHKLKPQGFQDPQVLAREVLCFLLFVCCLFVCPHMSTGHLGLQM